MLRNLFFTLLGFFGPGLLMLFFRMFWLRLKYQWFLKQAEPEIIDITPKPSHSPSRNFIFSWIVVSLITTGLLIWQMDNQPASKHTYIPAHIDSMGKFVPSQLIKPEFIEPDKLRKSNKQEH